MLWRATRQEMTAATTRRYRRSRRLTERCCCHSGRLARYEREVATLDLTDAAQAMARAQPRGDVDAPVDSSQIDLATGLYASADRHRRLAERLESGDGAPGDPGEMP